jgi:Ca2+-binding RTX toxin-like protein
MLDGGFDDEGVTFSSIEVLRVLDEERFAFGNRVTLGTQGADVIDYSGDAAALVYVNGGAGNDVITGPSGEGGFEFVRNTLIGGAGDDVLSSGGGQTTFDGGAGNDTINGGARDDVVDQNDLLNDGADTVNLGGGLDLVTLDSRSSDFNVVRLTPPRRPPERLRSCPGAQ